MHHGMDVQCSIIIVPLESDSTVDAVSMVNGDIIMFFECWNEMVDIVIANVFHTEIINDQCKLYWPCLVCPQS